MAFVEPCGKSRKCNCARKLDFLGIIIHLTHTTHAQRKELARRQQLLERATTLLRNGTIQSDVLAKAHGVAYLTSSTTGLGSARQLRKGLRAGARPLQQSFRPRKAAPLPPPSATCT